VQSLKMNILNIRTLQVTLCPAVFSRCLLQWRGKAETEYLPVNNGVQTLECAPSVIQTNLAVLKIEEAVLHGELGVLIGYGCLTFDALSGCTRFTGNL